MKQLFAMCVLPLLSGFPLQSEAQEIKADVPPGTLYYTGLTNGTWQIFSLKFPDGKPQQLTATPDDKREAAWIDGVEKLVAKNSNGDIVSISQEGKTEVFGHYTLPVANFSYFSDGKNLLMTHLTSRTYRKQWIYRASATGSETELFAKPTRGSYRSVRISPDNRLFACTLIQTLGEERLVVGEIGDPLKVRLLTEEGTNSGYPTWSQDSKVVYFSMRRPESNTRDLCLVALANGEISCLASTPDLDESAPFAESSGKGLFFHCPGKDGLRIGYMDLTTGKSQLMEATGISQEPFFRNDVSKKKGADR